MSNAALEELKKKERDLLDELRRTRQAITLIQAPGRATTIKDGMVQILSKSPRGLPRRELITKLEVLGAPCRPATIEQTLWRHKQLFTREGGRIRLVDPLSA
jgi:hypothetical protein